jgi:hypothetical protein
MRANTSKQAEGSPPVKEVIRNTTGQTAIHLEFPWPSAWTRLAAHLDFATAAVSPEAPRHLQPDLTPLPTPTPPTHRHRTPHRNTPPLHHLEPDHQHHAHHGPNQRRKPDPPHPHTPSNSHQTNNLTTPSGRLSASSPCTTANSSPSRRDRYRTVSTVAIHDPQHQPKDDQPIRPATEPPQSTRQGLPTSNNEDETRSMFLCSNG